MGFKQQLITAAAGVSVMSGVANASGVFTVTGEKASTAQLSSIAMAQQLLAGTLAHSSKVVSTSQMVNFQDPGNAGTLWHFGNKTPFNIDTAGVDQYFAIEATGTLIIPSPGNYTFDVNSDDGFLLTVGTTSYGNTGTKGSGDVFKTINFTKAGNFPIDLIYFQGYNQAQVELSATPGSFTTFGAAGSNFQLINNAPTSGALQLASTPEPASAAVIGISAAMLLKRRRRAA